MSLGKIPVVSSAGIMSLSSIAGWPADGSMWTISGSLKLGTVRLVLFRQYPGVPVKDPVLGSMTSTSSTHECAVVGATRRTSAARAAAAEVCILMCECALWTEAVGLRSEARPV